MVSNLPAEFFQRKEKEKKIWKRSLPTPKQANCFELKSLWQILLKLFSVYNFHFLPENLQYKRTNQKALLKSVISYNPNNKNWNNFWAKNYQKILNANKINSWVLVPQEQQKHLSNVADIENLEMSLLWINVNKIARCLMGTLK